ncbi:G-patch domain-containing protein [Fimicolochytrium jonesii]|uniref:G-patch domain-containing protein n=1 Tax=Fimicolochytrium jonesii TaxID=1396493 RepID=UPI0022FE5E5D|nr:G-patch domain-containing protein [Fimicolochytrium jonesii]KAI8816803.1 G-patch domain-containing protein [Fimicolochytrium jonesii]
MILALSLDQVPPHGTLLLLTPMTNGTRPCPYFLEGRCRSSKCGRSHGISMDASLLLPYELLDGANIRETSQVLAHYQDLYFPAKVVAVDPGKGFWVKFDGYGDDKSLVAYDQIIPMIIIESGDGAGGGGGDDTGIIEVHSNGDASEGVSSESGSDSKSGDEDDTGSDSDSEAEPMTFRYDDGELMGAWEVHTKGIGARLLAKMGYEPGKGLGKDAQGMIRPVEVSISLPGKGLGFERSSGAEHSHHHRRKRPRDAEGAEHKKRKHKRRKGHASATLNNRIGPPESQRTEATTDVFDFINTSLNKRPPPASSSQSQQQPSTASPRTKTTASQPSPSQSVNNHVQILQLQSKSAQIQKELARARVALARNAKDKKVSAAYTERIRNLEQRLGETRAKEGRLQGAVDGEKRKKRMVKF